MGLGQYRIDSLIDEVSDQGVLRGLNTHRQLLSFIRPLFWQQEADR